MIYKKSARPNCPLIAIPYQFLAPAVLRIRRPNGQIDTLGYGIGEIIEVIEPSVQYLIAHSEIHDEIPLADGSFVIEWPEDLQVNVIDGM